MTRPAPGPVRVLYLGGWGRSGSTLLDRMAGQLPGFASLGEVREIWQSGLTENRPCGCGTPFRSCEFWTRVGIEAFGGWHRLDLGEVLRMWRSIDRPWALPLLMAPERFQAWSRSLQAYVGVLDSLYRAIGRVSGARVLIDSSKLPSHGLLLRRVAGTDLRIVHLVRDSRGVAYSWAKRVRDRSGGEEGVYMERYRPLAAAARWLLYNEPTRLFRSMELPYLLTRYEDVVEHPRESLIAVAAHAGVEVKLGDLGFVRGREVTLEVDHTVDGNPLRFAVGAVDLRLDEEWRLRMRSRDRLLVTALTLPRLRSYGYLSKNGING